MKPARNIQKSIRISEDLYKEIEKFQGSTWNDKINNLLDFYITQHNDYSKYLNDLEIKIEEKQQLLDEFKIKISKFQDLLK
ncbi:MAG: hypothetical protein QW745_07690 [Thermoplasmata archaeon]